MVFQRDYSESCDGEDCVILKDWQSKTQWYDLSCDTRKPYVCEKNRGLFQCDFYGSEVFADKALSIGIDD